MIYLDHNATTTPTPAAREAVDEAMRLDACLWANPSSVHRAGQAVRHRVELARETLAKLLRVQAKHITFTSGGTESLGLAIRGVLDAAGANAPGAGALRGAGEVNPGGALQTSHRPRSLPVVVTSRVEHAAIRDLVDDLVKLGRIEARFAPIDSNGVVRVGVVGERAGLDELLRGATIAVFQWANNETGVVQPIDAIGAACRRQRVPFLCDGTQWIGKEPVPFDAASRLANSRTDPSGASDQDTSSAAPPYDLLAGSGHKFGGPKGIGFLWAHPGVRLRPQAPGAQELGRRAGTENVPGILGLAAAAQDATRWLADVSLRDRQRALRDRFERGVLEACPGARVNAQDARAASRDPLSGAQAPPPPPRLWNTTNIAFPRLEAEALLLLLSEQGLAASAGAACSSGSLDPSPVLLAMGVPEELAHGSLRFSLGRETTVAEIDRAVEIVKEAVRRLGRSSSSIAGGGA